MDQEFMDAFFEEAEDNLQKLNDAVLNLEKHPESEDSINALFRSSHTIKSSAAAVGLKKTSKFAHLMEDVMDRVRKEEISANEQIVELLFHAIDGLEEMVGEAKENGQEGEEEPDVDGIIEKLEKVKEVDDESKLDFKFEMKTDTKSEEIDKVKVDKERLDKLMNLVGQLLIKIRGIETEEATTKGGQGYGGEITEIAEDIRYEVMQARLTPVGQIFSRYPRTVRDIAKSLDKKVNLEMKGKDIELDRTILEEINEVIVHLLKNSLDHGLETPEERKKKDKPEEGTLRLEARKEKEKVVIEVSDDGAGIDIETLKDKLREDEDISDVDLKSMTKDELLRALCKPGVSTAKEVTEVSGRGVGLDVLQSKVEELNGEFEIETEKDEGTTIRMLLPVTLAIVDCMTIEIGGETYAIPLTNIASCKTIKESDIETIMNMKTFKEDGRDIPLIDLRELFNVEKKGGDEELTVVIISRAKGNIGVIVDELGSVREAVIKSLSGVLDNVNEFSGASILSDGTPILVINTSAIGKKIPAARRKKAGK